MKIAVTGATGFVSSRLVEMLQEQNHDVVAFRNAMQMLNLKEIATIANTKCVQLLVA